MRVFELDHDGGPLMDILRERRAAEAARPGLHVSTICDDLVNTRAKREPMPEDTRLMFYEFGNLLEDIFAEQLRQRFGWVKPEPRADGDGVIGSPDGHNRASRTIDEIKATWVKDGPSFVELDDKGRILSESLKFWRYRLQAVKYADKEMFDAERVRLHVFFMCGTHRPMFPTKPRTFTLRLTDEDRVDNAALLRQHAVDRGWLPERRQRHG